jgi:antibiotic biosynthesis monooxygenase (ABM) superfamily enzyme
MTASDNVAAAAAPGRSAGPNRVRFSLLVMIGVYPIITAISYAVAPFTAGWEIWQRGLLIAPIMVPLMVYGLIPFIQRRFRSFIMR